MKKKEYGSTDRNIPEVRRPVITVTAGGRCPHGHTPGNAISGEKNSGKKKIKVISYDISE